MPDCIGRDIAGMLRSFDYAAASVPGPDSAQWARDSRDAFLTGYASVARGSAAASAAHEAAALDADGSDANVLDANVLDAYEADKAIYEVVYEARNRPDWVGIPLAAVAVLANQVKE